MCIRDSINVDSEDYDLIKLICNGGTCQVYWVNPDNKLIQVGNFTVEKVTVEGKTESVTLADLIINMEVPESGVNTATFVIKIKTWNFTAGEKMRISYYDAFYGYDKIFEKDVGIGGVLAKITIDEARTVLPIPAYSGYRTSKYYVKVTVEDSDANKYSGSVETVPVYVIVIDGTGHVVKTHKNASYLVVNLEETGADTGVFEGYIEIVADASSGKIMIKNDTDYIEVENKSLIGGLLRVEYEDPLATVESAYTNKTVVYASKPFQASTAELEILQSAVELSDTITIRLSEPDLDQYSDDTDTLPSDLKLTFEIDGKECDVTLDEIDASFEEVEPGVFEWNVTAYDLLKELISTCGEFSGEPNDYVGKYIKVTYEDPVSAMSTLKNLVSATTSDSVLVKSHTAIVEVTPEEAGPYTVVYINITDPDLAKLSVGDVKKNLKISTSVEGAEETEEAIEEYKYDINKGTYVFRIKLHLYDEEEGQKPKYVDVDAHDTVAIVYKDSADETGATKAIVKYVTVRTETGTIEVPSTIAPDSTLTIKVKDLDMDKDPELMDRVTVTVYSSASPIRVTITLVETGVNTHEFMQRIVVTSDAAKIGEPNTIYAPAGSTIYVEYEDPLNAEAEEETVKAEVEVGVPAVEYPLKPAAEKAKLIDMETGEEITTVKVGQMVFIYIPVANLNNVSEVTFTAIVVAYKDGVPVGVTPSYVRIGPGATESIPVSLPILREPGTYTVKIYLWSDIVEQKPLSTEPVELTITVTE